MGFLLGLDMGTTTIKAVAYDPDAGRIVRVVSRPTPLEHPRPEWSQYDPDLFFDRAAACLREVSAGLPVEAMAISSMGETGLPLDAQNDPLYPLVAWHDRRGDLQVGQWESRFTPAVQHAISGQRVNPSFGIIKWLWFQQNEGEKARRMARWLSLPDYILWRLTGEQVTDYSIASRTLVFDQRRLDWSDKLLGAAGLDRNRLPPARPSGTLAGHVTPAAAKNTGLPAGLSCILGGHDHLCAAFAAGALQPGVVVDSMGTAEALVMVLPGFFTGRNFAVRSFACYAHVARDCYILKGGIGTAGMAVEWTARNLTGCDDRNIDPPYAQLEEEARSGVGRVVGPLWLPHWNGSGSPEADRFSRAALVGARIQHGRGDLFRGLLESLAFWTRQNLEEMESLTHIPVDRVVISGGAARLNLLVQLKADILNRPVEFPDLPETAGLGAALLAGFGSGRFSSQRDALASLRSETRIFYPDAGRAKWYDRIYRDVYRPLYGALKKVNHSMAELSGEKEAVAERKTGVRGS